MKGVVVWFTGLPGSGKSTLARKVLPELRGRGVAACMLDGDEVRQALHPPRGYDDAGRADFYRTLGGLAAVLARQGLAVLVPATAHRRSHREEARATAPAFLEVFIDTPLEECQRRDPKGLYARARSGEITGVPGLDEKFEAPEQPDVTAFGGRDAAAIEGVVGLVAGI